MDQLAMREIHQKINGALVSVDVSTDEQTAGDRVFGRVVGVEYTSAGLTILAELEEDNRRSHDRELECTCDLLAYPCDVHDTSGGETDG